MEKDFSNKKFGYITIESNSESRLFVNELKEYIKVMYLKKGAKIIIDFQEFECKRNTLFFINSSQIYVLKESSIQNQGVMIYYNRDFYCVEIHEKEVSCDGILFNNVFKIPRISLSKKETNEVENIFDEIHSEIQTQDIATEEMIRILLKQLIIKATRMFKSKNNFETNLEDNLKENENTNFLRKFSQLVEKEFYSKHTVAEYAKLLHITPKNLNKKIALLSKKSPNQIIKNRIILEAKRLLAHTDLSAKEIAYQLGYKDCAYFNRFFSKQIGFSPIQFRKNYHTNQRSEKVQFKG